MFDYNEVVKISETIKSDYPKEAKDFVDAFEWLNLAIEGVLASVGRDLPKIHKLNNFNKIVELAGFSAKLKEFQQRIIEVSSYFENQDEDDAELEEENILDLESEDFDRKPLPNYASYSVDQTVPHTLYEDYKFTRPCAFSFQGNLYEVRNMREVLVQSCGILAKIDIEKMESFVDDSTMKGRKVSYFSTKPIVEDYISKNEKIPETELYVWVNLSCNHIRNIIRKMLKKYGYSFDDFKIYLRADYSDLHNENVLEISGVNEKIGKYVNSCMKMLEVNCYEFSENEIIAMQSIEWCKKQLGIYQPLIKKYDDTKDILSQITVNGYPRYWKEIFIFNNKKYFVTSQWYERHRKLFTEWFNSLKIGVE